MIGTGRLATGLLGAAAAASLLSCLIAALTGSVPVAVLAAAAAVFVGSALGAQYRRHSPDNTVLMEKAMQQAESGRRLAIYERETGAFAHWYLTLRCDEECVRAKRYEKPLTLVLAEPAVGTAPWEIQERLDYWLRNELRASDLVGYSGNGRFVIIMPETAAEAAVNVIDRLRIDVTGTDCGLATFPKDGTNFDELSAVGRLDLRGSADRVA